MKKTNVLIVQWMRLIITPLMAFMNTWSCLADDPVYTPQAYVQKNADGTYIVKEGADVVNPITVKAYDRVYKLNAAGEFINAAEVAPLSCAGSPNEPPPCVSEYCN